MMKCISSYVNLTRMEILRRKMPAVWISLGHLVVGSRNVQRYNSWRKTAADVITEGHKHLWRNVSLQRIELQLKATEKRTTNLRWMTLQTPVTHSCSLLNGVPSCLATRIYSYFVQVLAALAAFCLVLYGFGLVSASSAILSDFIISCLSNLRSVLKIAKSWL